MSSTVRIQHANLLSPFNIRIPNGAQTPHYSTLIDSDELRVEARYDKKNGELCGDLHLYINVDPTDVDPATKKRRKGPYAGSVPKHNVSCYRILYGGDDAQQDAAGEKEEDT